MKSILSSVGKRAGTLVVVLHNFDHSGANQYIVNLICELSIRVVVVSPRSGPAISRFTTAGTLCSVQVGDVSEIEKGVSLPPLLITTTISTTPMVMVMVIVIVTTMMSILTLTFSSVSFYSYTLLDYAILCLDHSTTHAVFAKMRTALGDKVQQTQADEMAQV